MVIRLACPARDTVSDLCFVPGGLAVEWGSGVVWNGIRFDSGSFGMGFDVMSFRCHGMLVTGMIYE